MRLLSTTNFRFHEFTGQEIPEYTILSHTWSEEEVLFDDMKDGIAGSHENKTGFSKVKQSCQTALGEKYDWIWIDTCCIDKKSSAELTEAINSMFKWYKKSSICYAFLEDIDASTLLETPLASARWFSRGWTLQELIAPDNVKFYDKHWNYLGDRQGFIH